MYKFICICLLWLATALPAAAHAATPEKPLPRLLTAWMGEYETFAAWHAKQQGWDKEAGFELNMMPFDSGKNIMDNLAAYNWSIAGCGAVPALTTPLSKYLYIIGVADDESAANAIYVRANSPIAKTRGHVPGKAGLLGSPESLRKAVILCPTGTSAHYLLTAWLKALGVKSTEVEIRNMDPTLALSAFTGGVGDAVALWAPLTYAAEARGFKRAASAADCGLSLKVLLTANRDFADKHPEQVAAFLSMYLRGIEHIRNTPSATLAPEYARFIKEWTGREISLAAAEEDIKSHPVFSAAEQVAMLEDGSLQNSLRSITEFMLRQGGYTAQQASDMRETGHITTRFLKEALR